MTWDSILHLIKKGDSVQSKFFGTINHMDELGPTLTAMANTKGGDIVIGFDIKNYHLIGTKIDRNWIESLLRSNCTPMPEVSLQFIEKNEQILLHLRITNPTKKPYYYKNKCYVLNLDNTRLSIMEKEASTFPIEETQAPDTETQETPDSYDQEDLEKITDELSSLTEIHAEKPSLEIETLPNTETLPTIISENKEIDTLNHRQQKALTYLSKNKKIQNKTYRELFQVSHKTAHLELIDMVQKQLIMSQGSGRSTCYVLNNALQPSLI